MQNFSQIISFSYYGFSTILSHVRKNNLKTIVLFESHCQDLSYDTISQQWDIGNQNFVTRNWFLKLAILNKVKGQLKMLQGQTTCKCV